MTRSPLRSILTVILLGLFVFSTSGCGLLRRAVAAPIAATKGLVKTYKKNLEGYD